MAQGQQILFALRFEMASVLLLLQDLMAIVLLLFLQKGVS
jgi:hypothetical protein